MAVAVAVAVAAVAVALGLALTTTKRFGSMLPLRRLKKHQLWMPATWRQTLLLLLRPVVVLAVAAALADCGIETVSCLLVVAGGTQARRCGSWRLGAVLAPVVVLLLLVLVGAAILHRKRRRGFWTTPVERETGRTD